MNLDLRAVLAGVVAGLAVAVPLGAIGVLILQEGLGRGWRAASAAATGVALVDLTYAGVATAAGTAVTRVLEDHTRAIQLGGAAVLAVVGARGLLALRPSPGTPGGTPSVPPGGTPSVPPGGAARAADDVTRPAAVLRRFVAMTAVNPLTAVYFVVLAASLGATVAGTRAGTAFVAGVSPAPGPGSWCSPVSDRSPGRACPGGPEPSPAPSATSW